MDRKTKHISVLLKEIIEVLNPKKGFYIDCTLGGGGHTLAIIESLEKNEGGEMIAFDNDNDAIKQFAEYLKTCGWVQSKEKLNKGKVKIELVNTNFENLAAELNKRNIKSVSGIIADLGFSTDQIVGTRGFSYLKDEELDMRMDARLNVKAKDLVNFLSEKELMKLFWMSDEKFARRIAREIVKVRQTEEISTTKHLTNIIIRVTKPTNIFKRASVGPFWIKPVQRVFQALRIAVNSELTTLQHLLPQALGALGTGGIFAVISFHSGEDRIIKDFMKESETQRKIEILTKEYIEPSETELRENPSSRSAKLRIFKKI